MASLKTYLLEKIQSINEQAQHLSDIKRFGEDKSKRILLHLAKIYLNFDSNDEQKHIRETSTSILEVIDNKPKGSKNPIPASKLLFTKWLDDDLKLRNINALSRPAIYLMPDRYDYKKLNTLHDSDFTEQCITLVKWLDKNQKTVSKFDIRDKLYELFVTKVKLR